MIMERPWIVDDRHDARRPCIERRAFFRDPIGPFTDAHDSRASAPFIPRTSDALAEVRR
jgi:hypothetical protein